jgi:hypothetical protein
MPVIAKPRMTQEQRYYMERAEEQNERLIKIIEADHKVISENTATYSKVIVMFESMQNTMSLMQNTLSLLVQQVTTDISQQRNGVPVRVFLIVVVVLAAIIAVTIGLDISGMGIGTV